MAMEEITVNILGGTTFYYDKDYEAFRAEIDFAGKTVDVNLIGFPENEDRIKVEAEMLECIYPRQGELLDLWKDMIKNELLPQLEGCKSIRKITPVLFEQEYELVEICIHRYADEDRRIDVMFAEIEPEYINDRMSLAVEWNPKNGQHDFFVDGARLNFFLQDTNPAKIAPPKKKDFRLSCGEIAEYDFEIDVYYAVVDMADQEVGCYFHLDEDGKFPKKSIALFEKVYEKADAFDDMAIRFLIPRVAEKIRDISKEMEEPDLTVEKLLNEIALDAAVFHNDGTLEFSYLYWGETYDIRISAQGSYAMGFTKALIEVEEQ